MENLQYDPAGPKKITDFKIDENGKQFYKVKWESTWEPAEKLRLHQHLVTEFWSFSYYTKIVERVTKEKIKRLLCPCPADHMADLQRLSREEKTGVLELISRTKSSSADKKVSSLRKYELNSETPVAPQKILSLRKYELNSETPVAPQKVLCLRKYELNSETPVAPQKVSCLRKYELNSEAPVAPPSLPLHPPPLLPLPVMLSPPQTPVKLGTHPMQTRHRDSPWAYRFPKSPLRNSLTPVKNDSISDRNFVPSSRSPLKTLLSPTKQENVPRVGKELGRNTPKKQCVDSCKILTNAACLKMIQNFSNPYVKLNLVCKVCERQASLKCPSHWKRHFMIHNDDKTPVTKVEETKMPKRRRMGRPRNNENIPGIKCEEYSIKQEPLD